MDDTTRRVAELRGEIEDTRDEMSETIGAIQDKLRPAHIVAQATDRVKQATMEGVRDMAESATETARDAMSSDAIPIAIMGIGAAWLLINRNANRGPRRARNEHYNYEWQREETRRWRNTSAGHQYSTASDDFGVSPASMHDVRSTANDSASGGVYGGGAFSAGASGGAGWDADRGWTSERSAIDTSRRAVRDTQNRVERMVRDNPLLVGAGAMVIGAALGLAVPETDVENEWMGEARDSVVDRAQQMASDAAQKVKDSAESVADAAGRIVTGGDA